MKKVGSFLIQI